MESHSVLFTGKGGKSGSWKIRGEQMSQGFGGFCYPTDGDMRGFSHVVVVKRMTDTIRRGLDTYNLPWVFDAVDFYPQPHCLTWTKQEAITWVRKKLSEYKPDGVIWPNRKMMEDCDVDIPQTVIYHHHRPDIKVNPIREQVKTVGYEGGNYLGKWKAILEEECKRRGWEFVVNPENLSDLDIVVAFRDPTGYMPFSWKSQVKIANAHGSGTPFVGQPENGYLEVATGCEYWATDKKSISVSFDWLRDQSAREQIRDRFLKAAYTLPQAQQDLREFLCRFQK